VAILYAHASNYSIQWLSPHSLTTLSGCGPIGLITAAVAHAYSARKIIAFDINPSRVEFARKYISPLTGKPIIDHVFHIADLPKAGHHGLVNGNAANAADTAEISVPNGDHAEHKTPGDIKWTAAQERMKEIISQVGLGKEGGVDRVVEASGAEDGMLHGVAIAKQGAICKYTGMAAFSHWACPRRNV
jgi:D-xylulose reductase